MILKYLARFLVLKEIVISMNIKSSTIHYLLLLFFLSFATPSFSGEVLADLPAVINPNSKYIFFLHGRIVEHKGVSFAKSNEYGFYEYKKILDSLAKHNFIVVSEARGDDTKIKPYAKKIAGQVKTLIDNGVPAGNITVAGFSKGGKITLVSSSLIGDENINYVVLAGCIRKAKKFISKFSLDLKGRVLSIVDYKDDIFSSCKDMFNSSTGGLKHEEIILKEGSGHGVFYTPNNKWIEPMLKWIK